MRIPVSIQREIVRLMRAGLSGNQIAIRLNFSPTTVRTYQAHVAALQCHPDELLQMEDNDFMKYLGTRKTAYKSEKITPDWSFIQQELSKKNVTLTLLWEEYLRSVADSPEYTLSYPQFSRRYQAWLKSQRISMRQFFKPGDKMFVDYCGQTVPVTDPDSGNITHAQVFVAVLGASSYTFAYAVPGQKSEHWLKCHVEAFAFFGGVPQEVVPDNLKAAVIKHTAREIIINQAYEDCADHYHFLINPARSRKPKDKSLAEIGVQIVQRWILAALRNRSFFSMEELNIAISAGIEKMNAKESRSYKASRLQRFNNAEKAALQPLPPHHYELAQWHYHIRVPDDYHICWQQNYYSVPFRYRFSHVDLRITDTTLEILLNRKRLALHPLLTAPGKSTHYDHMPDEHKHQAGQEPESLLEWAENIGPSVRRWIQLNLEQRRDFANGLKSARQFRNWVREEQNHPRAESGCEFALRYGILSFQQLKRIIKNQADLQSTTEATSWVIAHGNLRGADYYKS